jgi:uncharacterized membrane protein YgaE (UPF0421/DUF939 family)
MKKSLLTYLVIPGIMLGIFIFFYMGAVKEMDARDQQKAAEKAKADAEEAKRKAEIERKATEDAEKRTKEREAAEAAKAAEKEAAYQKVMTQLTTEAADYNAQADKLNKEVQDLELAISQARTNKEKLNRETFELAKQVELDKIARRNAELEIQRMVDMTAKKMATTSVALPPPPALPTN